MEAGHLNLQIKAPISVLYRGQPVDVGEVMSVDPRFEYMNIPPHPKTLEINPKALKFLGEHDYSLPLADGRWIVAPRDKTMGMLSGDGYISNKPVGLEVPSNWADKAHIMDSEGRFVNLEKELIAP